MPHFDDDVIKTLSKQGKMIWLTLAGSPVQQREKAENLA